MNFASIVFVVFIKDVKAVDKSQKKKNFLKAASETSRDKLIAHFFSAEQKRAYKVSWSSQLFEKYTPKLQS